MHFHRRESENKRERDSGRKYSSSVFFLSALLFRHFFRLKLRGIAMGRELKIIIAHIKIIIFIDKLVREC